MITCMFAPLQFAARWATEGSSFTRVQGTCTPGYRVQGTGYRVQGTGYRVQGTGYRVQGIGYRVQGTGFSEGVNINIFF